MLEGTSLSSQNSWLWATPVIPLSDFPFSQLGIKVTSLTWVESAVQILKRDWEENRGYQKNSWGRSSCRTALEGQNGCDSCSPQLSCVGLAPRFASSDKQHPKNSSVGGISPVCPAQGRENIPARWDCSGLFPVMFGRALSMETYFIFIILLALKKTCNENNCNNGFCDEIYVNDESVSWSLIVTIEISSKFNFN